MLTQKFNVTGMTCSACSAHVEKSVGKLDGVQSVAVSLMTNSMSVNFDPAKVTADQIIHAVEQGGYGASLFTRRPAAKTAKEPSGSQMAGELKNMQRRLIISFLFLIPLFYLSMGHMLGLPIPHFFHGTENALNYAFTQLILTLPIVYINRKYYQVGFKTLFHRAPNMDSLIAIGSSAALIYGIFAIYQIGYGLGHGNTALVNQYTMDLYFESAGMILTLITLGKYLETRSRGKTSEAITKLMDLAPKNATIVRNGQELEIPVEEVIVGDIFLVRPGQRVPVDGVVLEGSSSIDQSAITGESIPVSKGTGDLVTAATINKTGFLKCQAQKVGDDTTLAQIIQLVEDASASKAPIAKLADKISGVFVPVVITIALVSAVIWLLLGKEFTFALSTAISVLVISCPCALGLATPVAIMVGTGKGAENGILIKSAESLETAHTIQTVVLDKTGTVTEGKPQVTDLLPAPGVPAEKLLLAAVSMEQPSEHPLAEAIVSKGKSDGITALPVEEFKALSGLGISGKIKGELYFAGNQKLMEAHNIPLGKLAESAADLAQEGKTPLFFASESNLLGIVAAADTVKPTSRRAIAEMKSMGLDVVMLTGDNKRTAEAIRRQLGIDKVVAEVLPQDKETEIRRLQESGRKVAMVGDGINDAPALARADVGIAIGAGTDVAIESADIVLMKSDLLDAVTAIQLSKAVIRNIKENLFWAFFYNSIGIPLAAGVFVSLLGWQLNPMFAAAAMSLSSVCVVLNALRLKLFRPHFGQTSQSECPTGVSCPVQIQQPAIQKQNKGEITMTKTIKIEGMSCSHCSARVEKALNAVAGVSAQVDLESKKATVTLSQPVEDAILRKAVEDAGYEVVSIS